MAQISATAPATAYHVVDGPHEFPYAVDAQSAVGRHPLEWSFDPWTADDAAAARKAKYDADVAAAQAAGVQPPPAPPEPVPLSPEDQAALDDHNKAVAEAAARLADYYKKRDEQKKIDEQVAADEALVKSPPPQPDLTRSRRPFGRKGDPTPAEQAAIDKKAADAAAKKAADDKLVADKAEADRQAAAAASGASVTGAPST